VSEEWGSLDPLVRALMPPDPEEREKRELHEQVGRAIVELSNAEDLLAVIFCVLSIPVLVDRSKKTFASQGSFEKKLDLVDFLVRMANHPKEKELWFELHAELNNHRGVRNLVAHQRRFTQRSPDSPEVEVSLTPLFYKKESKGLRTSEIKATADELEKINRRLWSFIKLLTEPR
jgi:hypothetical protein